MKNSQKTKLKRYINKKKNIEEKNTNKKSLSVYKIK